MPSQFETLMAELPETAYVRRRFSPDLSDLDTPVGGWVCFHLVPERVWGSLLAGTAAEVRQGAHRAVRWVRPACPALRWPRPALHLVMSLMIRWTL